jgi:methylmalonyl-CoA/ethylmalonyl-CoA epimerase
MVRDTEAGITRIGQIAVNVRDVNRAVRFYQDVLGLEFLFDAPNMAFFRCGEVRLMLSLPSEPELDHPASIIYYKVDDIEVAHETLVARGAEFERKPTLAHKTEAYELWLAFLRDPEGNLLALMSEIGEI